MDTPTDKSQIGGNKLRDIAAQLETSRGKTAQDISDDQDLLTTMGLTCRTAAKKPEDMKPPVKTPSHKTQAALMETLSASSTSIQEELGKFIQAASAEGDAMTAYYKNNTKTKSVSVRNAAGGPFGINLKLESLPQGHSV